MKKSNLKIDTYALRSVIGAAFVLFGIGVPGREALAQGTEWVARYNGLGNDRDEANALAVDAAGNVYITGVSRGLGGNRDYTTVKYDPNGNQLWEVSYDGPASSYDVAEDLALDAAGNVYVTGYSRGSGTLTDYATIKYDTDGNQLWVARYNNAPVNGFDNGRALALDAAGNVYVTGSSRGAGTFHDYATVKYDPNGNEVWVRRYNGPLDLDDAPEALAVDVAGNVYVTGRSPGSGTFPDYLTIKYDTDGNEVWVRRYDGPGEGFDVPRGLALDAAGNVYVTGYSRGAGTGPGTFYDYATIKYDPNGNRQWVARYDGPDNDRDMAEAVALDAAGNVYVTGYATGSGYATIKYDTDGIWQWVTPPYDGAARALALDAAGNVYVTGSSTGSGTGWDYATIKYKQPFSNCIDFEDLLVGTTYTYGDMFSSGGVPISVQMFTFANNQQTTGTGALVDNQLRAGGSGNDLSSNNVNLDFAFGGPVNGLNLRFGEFGGNLNLEINGDFRNFANFSDINGQTIGGVTVSVVNGLGNDQGTLSLSGTINGFVVGGQELWIDDVCPGPGPIGGGGQAWGLSLHAGIAVPLGSLNNTNDLGPTVGVDLVRRFTPQVFADLRIGYSLFPGSGSASDFDVVNLSANLKVIPVLNTPWVFLNGGFGLYYLDTSNWETGYNLGAGLGVSASSNVDLELTANYHATFAGSPTVRFGKLQLGLIFWLP